MKDVQETCRIAVIQAEPVMFDKAGGLKKALRCIRNAAAEEAELIVFPELFIPGYPIGMNFGFSMGKRTEAGRADWKRYYDASLIAGGEEFKQLSDAARDAKAYVSMGFSERDAINGTLYNSNVIFSPDGSWSVHRKLKPTGSERLVWGDANRDYFPVVETPWGPIGSMICWESYMPLARVALYQKGIMAGHHPAHCHRGQVLLHQLRHGCAQVLLSHGSADHRRHQGPARYGLPGRQLHHRPLRACDDVAGLGRGDDSLCRPRHDVARGLQNGARCRRSLFPSGCPGTSRPRVRGRAIDH